MEKVITEKLQKALQDNFKFSDFRPGQLEALHVLMEQERLLCIQPTGYGKSLLYQLPAVILDGLTLVISPLLALMRDQVAQLKNRFGISAASINTDQDEMENITAREAAKTGKIKILFIAPEQLDHVDRFDFLLNLPIKLLVVDEAHCISTWGHDFRPSYRQIIKLAQALVKKIPDLRILGLTATANSKTEIDIQNQFKVDNKKIILHRESMNRANIRLTVLNTSSVPIKLATLLHLLTMLKGSGIIYCATRENTELVAAFLREQGVLAAAYHAGIDNQLKRQLQNDFVEDKYTVISATNALGMGIDKSNLRYIIHFDYPGSITAYYQEVGRAGRDGNPAEGILLYNPADYRIQKHCVDSAQPLLSDFQNVLQVMSKSSNAPNLSTIKRLTGMHPTKLTVVVAELIEQGYLRKISHNRSQIYELTNKSGNPNLNRYDQQYMLRNAELSAMQRYCEIPKICLMSTLRVALGDKEVHSCGQCNNCSEVPFQAENNKSLIFSISSWLSRRTVTISLSKKITNVATGMAILDGKLRSADFVQFMKERMQSQPSQLGLSEYLSQLIKACLTDLTQHHQISCIIPIPSGTWIAREAIINLFANYLKIPAFSNLLSWRDRETPRPRQGELLNNDQRQHNVAHQMKVNDLQNKIPETIIPNGVILLWDDYIGSGATLNEAARVLREHKIENEIVPFTIAAVKWRLGSSGMI